ncbi:branched-chain amino acid ABC transporter substrate-binding protein [Acuticoccus sediminis]|uniref:Branched-chain amino acid ABC transporter substrate-binding protein n=1 Tax=Acuticoccus sediminis TaxID=2184697 RepID=A0A8B2NQE1_9HYPH|nr:ABC transporter substrate-binding protein [Acuticoccus sediminis]RAH99231.1 branched-chain amino acid ABC transporter substrate-binding protein [Acuticoccus sediminis]
MLKAIAAATAALVVASGAITSDAIAADKPDKVKVGITTFLSGPASVFGVPGRAAAEILAKDLNDRGGIGGVPVELFFTDEGAGGETLASEFRRLVQDEKVDVMMAAISSGNCLNLAPLAEDLEVINILWDCGTQRIFEEEDYKYNFRTQGNATPEMMAALLYLLQTKPDFSTIAVVNQDYAWGRDSWNLFSSALKALKPDVKVVAELFPRFGAPDYSAEISRLQALRPDVILSTSWGGDLETFVRQASQRGLTQSSTFVLPLAESSLQRLGGALPDGAIVGGRGDHYFLHPETKDTDKFKAFVAEFQDATGDYPIYPAFHMAQAFAALEGAYAKAIEANGGEWPDEDQVIEAMNGLSFTGLGREVTLREDHQGLEDQLIGTARTVGEYDFPIIDNMRIYAAEDIMPPVGTESVEWIGGLDQSFLDTKFDAYTYGD